MGLNYEKNSNKSHLFTKQSDNLYKYYLIVLKLKNLPTETIELQTIIYLAKS